MINKPAQESEISPCAIVGISVKCIRDVLAKDEPTRTCCGPLPSWAPKIKTLEKIKKYRF
jgi:hypothetical protein